MDIEIAKEDYRTGKVILIDKPLTWTSFDVVNKVRWHLTRALKIKKIKVGHAGTLDPLATGLLILCTGQSTKMIEAIQDAPKTYVAEIALGATTPSYDLETEIDQTYETKHITEELVKTTIAKFIGEQEQTPPIFSAKKINGKPAYSYARKQVSIEMKTKRITFHSITLEKYEPNNLLIRINCSKGTYIRSFAYDLGIALNSGAYLKGLRRTEIGGFNIDDAWILEDYIEKINTL